MFKSSLLLKCGAFMAPHRVARRCARALAAISVALAGLSMNAASAGVAPWPDAPFSYYAENAKLETVLAEFAANFTLNASIQPNVTGVVNGRFTARNPTEFISRLGGVYGFSWYTYAGTLYVSRAGDDITRSLPIPGGGLGNMRNALLQMGVLDPRFGWGELPSQGIVMVSGPPTYVALIEATLRQMPASTSSQQLAVFRLRYATADDHTVRYRDTSIVHPGLASVLRNLVLSGAAGAGGGVIDEPTASAQPPLPAMPGAAPAPPLATTVPNAPSLGGANPPPPASPSPSRLASGGVYEPSSTTSMRVRGESRARVPSIQAEPRLNAIIVQDVPERIPLYEAIIAQLDVPSALIEIEAMILDVNAERSKDLGISWGGRAGHVAGGYGTVGGPAPGAISLIAAPGASSVTPGTLVADAGNYLVSQIRLLETVGDARIQSRPSVLTIDNIGAILDLSETFYIRLSGERVATVTPVTAGTTLRVTPRLLGGPEPSIQLQIDIEDGQIQDRQIDAIPTIRRSSVSTQAVVRQNETLLIAGYASDQNVDANQKVPVLGDIPALGLLFSNKVKTVQRRERMFMIRPKLVRVPGIDGVLREPPAAALTAPAAPMNQ